MAHTAAVTIQSQHEPPRMRGPWRTAAPIAILATLAGALTAVPANPAAPPVASALGRWFETLPGWGCYEPPYPAAHQVAAPIGPEVVTFLGGEAGVPSAFTDAPLNPPFTRVGAIDDPAHGAALFWEHGQDRGSYLLVANAGAPPVAVKRKDLSSLSMGGKVHLGDTLESVRKAFAAPATFRLTTMGKCAFPNAGNYSAVNFYGPPHHPRLAATLCDVGPDIARGQTIGTVVFRAGRVAVLIWNYEACSA